MPRTSFILSRDAIVRGNRWPSPGRVGRHSACRSNRETSLATRVRTEDRRQQIRFRRFALEMWITFALVIIELERLEDAGVLDQQLEGLRIALRACNGFAH